jgi:hypothetical protein
MALTAKEQATLQRLLAKADVHIETPRLKGGDGKTKNTRRAFWTDGTHAYLRRKKANEGIAARTDAKVKAGEYRHVKTSDDVEIFEIADDSPLRRQKLDVSEMPLGQIEREIVAAACKRDWPLYYDAVSELAHRYKNGDLPSGTAETILQNTMQYLHVRILRRGGPSDVEIGQALAGIRKARTGKRVFLPPDSHIERH